jgi:integrase/recombinase XerD
LLVFDAHILHNEAKRIKGIRWSTTHGSWYLPLSRESYALIKSRIADKALIDHDHLKTYLVQRQALIPLSKKEGISQAKALTIMEKPLREENLEALKQFVTLLELKAYSKSTFATYTSEFFALLKLLGPLKVSELTKPQVQSYLLWLIKVKGHSEAKIHTTVNALKFYFEGVEKRGREFYDLPRPKKPLQLPRVLSSASIVDIINKTQNLKHKCMLMLAYSAGLRVSEITALTIANIDSKRMTLFIERQRAKKTGW